jgi:hypothetical protein
MRRAGLILLFDGEVGPDLGDHDEHSQTDVLTSGINLAPAFPSRSCTQEEDSGPWEFVTRYSGVTVPDFHRVPKRMAVMKVEFNSTAFKEQPITTPGQARRQAKTRGPLELLRPC